MMNKNAAKRDEQRAAELKKHLRSLCGIHGMTGVIKALCEISGDFSGRQGDLFDSVNADEKQAEIAAQWTAAWAVLDKTLDELKSIFID